MVEDDPEFRFDRHIVENLVERFAAGHAVFVVVRSTIRRCDEVFDTRFARRYGVTAEKALVSLEKEEPFELFHGWRAEPYHNVLVMHD